MPNDTADYSLHGLLTIRLAPAGSGLLDDLKHVFGPSRAGASGVPDIHVSFTKRLPHHGRLRFLGLNEAAFDDESFYLLDRTGRRTQIDFRDLGKPCQIVCEHGASPLLLLLSIVGLRLLDKGHVLLHSCAFSYRGKGTVVAGWRKGGKTEMLLAFMAAGGSYVADEWTIVSPDGGAVYGLAGSVPMWSWQLRHLPEFWRQLRASQRMRIRMLRMYQRLYRAVPGISEAGRFPFPALHRLSLEGGSGFGVVQSEPEALFRGSVSYEPIQIDRLFLAMSWDGPTIVRPIDGAKLADRMASSLGLERSELMTAYQHFKFAFPDRRNERLENAEKIERELLARAFSGKHAYEVLHPYPVALEELHSAAAPLYA